MVQKLMLKDTSKELLSDLITASSIKDRTVGLLKFSKLEEHQGLWILNCNSIHTCFMKFSIDCLFIDKELKIKKIYSNVKPWRMTFPVFSASSVIEVNAGSANNWGLKEGDTLYVES